MSTPVRWVSVDDTSTDVRYVGDSWFVDRGSLDTIGHNGPPFLSTLHGTNISAGFAFNFTGSGLRVMGTYTGTQNSSLISWTCLVDGVNLGKTTPNGDFDENHRMFCQLSSITDGPHTVTLNATLTVEGNQTFWLDKIQYIPSASVSLENKTIQIDRADPAILYGSGWSSYQTQMNGSQLGCNFYGASVIWYGTELSGNSTTGTWTIDDNLPNTFIVNGSGTNGTPVYNKKFFETPQYSMGSHRLAVTYNGDNSTTPLYLAYLVVQNGTLPQSTTSNSTGSSPNATSSTNTGAIIGGALGGAACLFILILVCFYRIRRRSQNDRTRSMVDSPMPIPLSPPDTTLSSSQSGKTHGRPPGLLDFHPRGSNPLSPDGRRPGGAPRAQDERLMGNISQFVTVPREPSREEHLPGPRKLQNAAEHLRPSDDGYDSREPLEANQSNLGGPIHLQPVGQELSPLTDAPPAYS